MTQRVLAQLWHRATFSHHHIIIGILALGHIRMGNVGYGEQHVGHILLSLLHNLLKGLVSGLQFGHLILDLVSFILLAFLHQAANFLGQQILLLLVGVYLLLGFSTDFIVFQYLFYSFTGTRKMLFLESLDDAFSVFTDKFKCKHNALYL